MKNKKYPIVYTISARFTDKATRLVSDEYIIGSYLDYYKAVEHLIKAKNEEIERWKNIGVEVKRFFNTDEKYWSFYGENNDGQSFYFDVKIDGIPIIFNYDNDWKCLRDKQYDNYTKTTPIKKLIIVKQDMRVLCGCLPDLQDSAYTNFDDAERRIKELFDKIKESWEKEFGEVEVMKDYGNVKILQADEHHWFKAYISAVIDNVK